MPDSRSQLSAKAQASLGLPEGIKFYSPFPFGGMNVQASSVAVADNEFLWLENFVRLGDGNLRTVWDRGASIYIAPGGLTIVWHVFFNIGAAYYCAVFLSDGSAVQVSMATLAQAQIGPPGLFYDASTGYLPYARQWGTQYLLISNRNTVNDYWAWDGSLLYGAGTAAPNGVDILSGGGGYGSAPTLTVYGGFGSGIEIVPVVIGGEVVEMNIASPGLGYEPGDIVQVAFSGGGSDSSAILQASLAPTTVGGVTVTAPGSGYTFAGVWFTGGGGGSGVAATATIVGGAVTSIVLTSAGSGYTTAPSVQVFGNGSGALATAALTPSGVSAGSVVSTTVASITVVGGGSGYTQVGVSIVGGGGSGATATATLSSGSISEITMETAGSGYISTPSVVIAGDGANASATAVLTSSATVPGVAVVNGGSNFTSVPTLTITGGGGSGATAIALLAATTVASINLTSGGSGYTSAPTISFTGGGGSGAAATAYLSGGQVAYVVVTSAGSGYTSPIQVTFSGGGGSGAGATVVYAPTSINSVEVMSAGRYYTTAPAVEVSSGANNAAAATVMLMPFGVSGSVLETFLSRAWVYDPAPSLYSTLPPGGDWEVSAPGSFVDFATSDGAVSAVNTDAFLNTQYTQARQSSGYLYALGDGSISVISNVNSSSSSSSSGSSVSTTFNYQNVDPQIGCAWRDSLQDFGRSTIFANATGVYGLYGGAATKISGKLDQLFASAAFPPTAGAATPAAAVATIYGVKHYLLLMTVTDPDTGALRNVMATWNEKEWFVTSQSVSLAFISTQKQGSEYAAYGTDGSSIYPLFSAPSSSLQKRLDTKMYGSDRIFVEKAAQGVWFQAQDNSAGAVGVSGTLAAVVSGMGGGAINGYAITAPEGVSAPFLNQVAFASPPPFWNVWGTAMEGNGFFSIGLRFVSSSPDFTLADLVIGYTEHVAFFA